MLRCSLECLLRIGLVLLAFGLCGFESRLLHHSTWMPHPPPGVDPAQAIDARRLHGHAAPRILPSSSYFERRAQPLRAEGCTVAAGPAPPAGSGSSGASGRTPPPLCGPRNRLASSASTAAST